MPLFRNRELSLFYQQLGQLYKSGVTPIDALTFAGSQVRDRKLHTAIQDIQQQVLAGRTLGSAFAAQSHIFSPVQVALVTVGEENGQLDKNFFRLSEMYENEYLNRKKLTLALLYPAFLLVAALFLPKVYIWWTGTFTEYIVSVLTTATPFLLLFGGIFVAYKSSQTVFAKTFDQIQLELPLIGNNLRKLALARFSRCLAMLYDAGVDLRRGVRMALPSFGNHYLEAKGRVALAYLEEGGTLTTGFRAAQVFPREFVQSIELGEQTGNLGQVLENNARLYEAEAEKVINTMLFFLPIAIYLLVALYIAFVVIQGFSKYYGGLPIPQ